MYMHVSIDLYMLVNMYARYAFKCSKHIVCSLFCFSQQERQASVLKCNALYSKLQPTGVDDEEEKYQKLEHHKRDSTLSINQYDRVQDYAKDGPLESDTTYEDLPYFEVNSKSN